MPKIYEYMGIVIKFHSNEHEPIHVHAEYGKNVIKVSFFVENGKIYRTTYSNIKGEFPPAQVSDLKKFISAYKEKILEAWANYFVWRKKIDFERITRKV